MITSIRRIRRSLLKDNKVTKYLLYALGEIILVVVGILIALYFNDLYETQKKEALELEILVNIRQEFKKNLLAANNSLRLNKDKQQRQQLLLNFTDSDSLMTAGTETYFNLIMGSVGTTLDVSYEDGRLQELFYTGRIQLITNDSLRSALSGWENTRKDLEEQLDYVNGKHLDIMNALSDKGNLRQLFQHIPNETIITYRKAPKEVLKNSALFSSDRFQNKLLLFYYGSVGLNLQILPNYIADLENIIVLLDKEIQHKTSD